MANHISSLPTDPTGSNPIVDWCKKIARCIRERSLIAGPGIRLAYTARGTVVEATAIGAPGKSQPVSLKRFLVISVQNDHLVCKELSGVSAIGPDINVAKPYDLRRTGWDGITVTYAVAPYPGAPATRNILYSYDTPILRRAAITLAGLSTTEYQEIIPYYVPNKSQIFAVEPENDTGVAVATWQDLNTDGRAWARAV